MSRPSAADRLARLLAMVPWVVAHDGPLVSEVCDLFGITEKELLAELNLLFMCGIYPYTPDALIEVDIDGGRVWVRFAEWFRRPLRLAPTEGLALVAAARAMLEVPGPSAAAVPGAGRRPLESAVGKLEMILGAGGEEPFEIEIGVAPAEVLATLQRATAASRKVVLQYYSFGRDETSVRTVQPWRVFSSGGQWYLLAWCERAGGKRLFRVDRARSATALEDAFEPPEHLAEVSTYVAGPDDPVVVLDLAPGARWVAEQYPNEGAVEIGEGHVRVQLRASSPAWLERLLLRAGPDAKVISGAEGVAEQAARRVLGIYGQIASDAWP